jgi:hypothetical protein
MSGRGAFPLLAALPVAMALTAGCGGGEGLTHGDVKALVAAKSRFLEYCGERKANGADETQPVPPGTEAHVTKAVAVIEDHRDETFVLDGKKTTVRAFGLELREILDNCSDQQLFRIDQALD